MGVAPPTHPLQLDSSEGHALSCLSDNRQEALKLSRKSLSQSRWILSPSANICFSTELFSGLGLPSLSFSSASWKGLVTGVHRVSRIRFPHEGSIGNRMGQARPLWNKRVLCLVRQPSLTFLEPETGAPNEKSNA